MPNAFAQDAMALALAQEAISLGLDQELHQQQRAFLYMPFMHSESQKNSRTGGRAFYRFRKSYKLRI